MLNKISKLIVVIGFVALAASPLLVYAQTNPIGAPLQLPIPGVNEPATKPATTSANSNSATTTPPAQTPTELPVYNAGVDRSIQDYLCTPSQPADGHDLERCVNRLYRFGISAGALVLVFLIIYAGYIYITSDESGKTKAKGYIKNSLTGMGILLGSYVLLNFINPSLVTFKPIQPPIFNAADLPSCEQVGFGQECLIEPGKFGVSTGNGGAVSTGDPGKLPPGGKCLGKACPAPSTFSPPLADLKSSGATFKNNSYADPSVVEKMKALKAYLDKNGGPALRVTEAYPPTSMHSSTCHFNGRCFDISPADKNVQNFNNYCKALKAVGITSFLNEASSQATECGPAKSTTFGTGAHIHINTYK